MIDERRLLLRMFDAAVASAQPLHLVPRHLPPPPRGRTIVVGAGKATAAMASALDDAWPAPLTGVVVTRYGHAVPCNRIDVVEASHPIPDEAGIDAARRVLAAVHGLTADDLVICLISGGGSALLPLPLPGIALEDKQNIARSLLASGAPISDINCVRRHLSAIKGGRLAAACHPARVVTLAISDVPGDDPIDIASGPTVADPTTREDALAVLARYRIAAPPAVAEALRDPAAESVKPGDPRLARATYHLIATPQMALEAAAAIAHGEGVVPLILADSLEGEARDVGKMLAAIARQVATHGQPIAPPCVLLSGGETTVTVPVLENDDDPDGAATELVVSSDAESATVTDDGALRADADAARVGWAAHASGVALTELRSADGGLEDMFLQLTADTQRERKAA